MGEIIKSLFPDDKSNQGLKINAKQKKYVLWLGIIIVVGIGTMLLSSLGGSGKNYIQPESLVESSQGKDPQSQVHSNLIATENYMEEELENILRQIAGVGEVAVDLTLETSPELKYATNISANKTEVSEQAQDGSTRVTSETREDVQVVMKNVNSGINEPVITQEIRPQVVGVMVVAEGAGDLIIKERISQAVQTLLNIPAHRVTVLPKGE
ncbi:MAG: stage III sporulation protein AH [Clostridia bacterium]|nr:stage III sporulation protein AH [Clostridia bacterium]